MRETQPTANGETLELNTFANPPVFSLLKRALLDILPEEPRKLFLLPQPKMIPQLSFLVSTTRLTVLT
jgi:hypothetical protein